MMAALLTASVPVTAQQKRTVKRTTTTAKRTQPRKKVAAQPVKIVMDEPCIAGGALAFNGIPINLPAAEMASELKSQGFQLKKDDYGGDSRWHGTAFGAAGIVYVGTNPAIVTFTEKKNYSKAQARKRVMAYKDAFEEASGCQATESTMSWNSDEGGMVKIPVNTSSIQISYANTDEVDFSSNLFTVMISYFE